MTRNNAVISRRPSVSLVGPTVGKRLSLAADCSRGDDIEAAGVAPAVAATAAGILPQGLNPTAKHFGFKMVPNLLLLQGTTFRVNPVNQMIVRAQNEAKYFSS